MTWRQFLTLVNGLSTSSALITMIAYRKRNGLPSGTESVTQVEGPEQTQRVFVSLFGQKQPRTRRDAIRASQRAAAAKAEKTPTS